MASSMDKLAKELKKQMTDSDERKPKPYDTQAEVLRVENGVAWVHIPGGVDETPVRLTINAKKGDNVNLHVANGTAWITGNSTNPPTDDSTANYAVNISNEVKKDVTVLNNIVVEEIEATNARFINVEADTAKIHDLTADKLHATVGYIDDLTADSITAQDISASSGYVKDLKSNNIEASNIVADHGTIENLDSNYAHIKNGVIDNAKINYADVNDLSAHYAEIQNGHINSALINTAAIVDEQVFTVEGNKATIKEINADNINVRNLNAKNLKIETADGYVTIGDKKTPTKEFIDSLTNELNDRIDGAIETYTSTAVPTLSNYPANAWATDEVKATHVGDVCYVVNNQIAQNGYCYRFTLNGTTFSWQLIKDSDVTAALSRLTTAEGKIGNIEAFDEDIATFKTETEGEISTLQTKTTTLETSIGDKVDKTVFNEVKQTVEGNSSSITTLSETTTTLRDDLDNLAVGGRNLLKNTEQQRVTPASANNSAYVSPVPRLTDYGLSVLNNTETWWTYSFDYEVTGNTAEGGYIYVQVKGAMASGSSWLIKDKPSGHYAQSFKLTSAQVSATTDTCNIRLRNATDGAILTAKNLKLEKGNKETDWTPAPEDMGETVTTISNTVNEVKQTGETNSSHISKLTQTLGTNADGSTKSGDVMHQVSDVVQDLSGFKTTVSETYATKDRLAAAETKITQNTNDISLTAEKSVHMSKPNLSPFFQSMPFTTSAGYWTNVTSSFTPLEDGWAHFLCDNTSGTDTVGNIIRMVSCPSVFDGESYTCLVEIRNLVSNATSSAIYTQQSTAVQFWGSTSTGGFSIANSSMTNGSYYMPMTALGISEHGTDGTRLMHINWQVPVGAKIEADIRISLYAGEYSGEYKPYVGSQMYASQAELKIAKDNISSKVSTTDYNGETIASLINQTADTVKIEAEHIELDGTTTFNAIKSKADAAYDAIGAAQTAVDGIEVGGRNLFLAEPSTKKPSVYLALCIPATVALSDFNVGDKLTVQLWGVEIDANSSGVRAYWGGGSVPLCENTKPDANGYISFTYTVTKANREHAHAVRKYINVYNPESGHTGSNLTIERWKLEKGNKATDWTPAPEDVQSEIDAKKSVHTLDTSYSYTYANILTYSAEGYGGTNGANWVVANTAGVKAGDTVRLKVTVSNMGTDGNRPYVYVIGEVVSVTDTTQIRVISHGLDTTIIDGGNILTNSITALQIDTGAITADELSANAVIAGKIKAGAVTTDKIAANAITASKLAIGDFNNYVTVNENNEDTLISGFVIEDGWLYKNVATSTNAWLSPILPQWAKEGEQYRVTGKVKTKVAGKVRIVIYGRTSTGSASGSSYSSWVTTKANTETEFSGVIKITSAVVAKPGINIVIQFQDSSGTNIVGYCKEMRCERIVPYITQINENGIRIHPAATENNSVVINADGMEVFKGGTADEYSVAFYGDSVRIGQEDKEHISLTNQGFNVLANSRNYVNLGLLNDESGQLDVKFRTVTVSSILTYNLQLHVKTFISAEYDDGVAATVTIASDGYSFTVDNPRDDAILIVQYITDDPAPYYVLGTKRSGTSTGLFGLLSGYNNAPRAGQSATLGGRDNYIDANAGNSVIIGGFDNTISGFNAVALGGNHLTVQGRNQVVMGYYNVPQGTPATAHLTDDAFIIGNGTSSNLHNAMAIRFDGEISSGRAGRVLWSGGYFMTDTQTATFTNGQKVSDQLSGIVLVWSAYDSGKAQDYNFDYQFIPKWHVLNHNGSGVDYVMIINAALNITLCKKYVYVYDDKIVGNANNNKSGTGFNNAAKVLRAVIGI